MRALLVVEGDSPDGTVGGTVLGAMPVVAGGLVFSRAVRVLSSEPNTSSRITMTNAAAAFHPHGVEVPPKSLPRCRGHSTDQPRSVERVLRSHSKLFSHLTGNRRPPADRRICPRHRKQVANPINLPQVLHHFAEWKHLGSVVIDVIQDVPREICGERVNILAALDERDWVKLKEDRWGLGAGQQVGCATQDSRFAAFRVDLDKTWPTPDECTELIERNGVRPRQPMVRTSV